jgi:hypothetical protein
LNWGRYPEVGDGNWRYLIIDEPDEDGIGEPVELPTLDVMLARLEQNALVDAEQCAYRVPHPTSPTAQARFVAYRVVDHFQRTCGTPLYDMVATITAVACNYDQVIDEIQVRDWIRTRDKPERSDKTLPE